MLAEDSYGRSLCIWMVDPYNRAQHRSMSCDAGDNMTATGKSHLWCAAVVLAGGLVAGGSVPAQDSSAQRESAQREAAAPVDSAVLVAAVKQELLRSPDASALDVRVEARDGVVTLSGTVATDAERITAERVARMSAGVRGVENRIIVREADGPGPGDASQLPRNSPTPVTPGAPALPNGMAIPGVPGG